MESLLKCLSKNGRSASNSTDFRSVLEIDQDNFEDHTKCKHITDKHNKSCCNLELIIPGRILRLFHADAGMTRLEKTLKASLLIQQWYRRNMARLEIRRRYTWTIFQTLEYAGEQDQIRLYHLFNAFLTHIPKSPCNTSETEGITSVDDVSFELDEESPDDEFYSPEEKNELKQFVLEQPYTQNKIIQLIELYRKYRNYRLPPKIVGNILKWALEKLKKLPNINKVSTALSKQITVCGDLHGKFDDLLVILYKNGLPSADNPYVFNGDFVDRGPRGLEVLLILLLFILASSDSVYLNRGNHEDIMMNQRYGFVKEIQSKYRKNHEKLLKLIEAVYQYLPLGTLVNNEVLIVHGGISDITDLERIKSIDRRKYVSLLRPPLANTSGPNTGIDKLEWKQIFDILWSDPQDVEGCIPNSLRGAGTYFGPDVTKRFLERNNLRFIIRSHECKANGYEVCHNGKVITIFSASNYYEVGSNKGAYMKLVGCNLDTHYVQYTAVMGKKKMTLSQRMGLMEASATRELQMNILKNKEKLEEIFNKMDPTNSGEISVADWCKAMEEGTGLQIPWRLLKERLVTVNNETNRIIYRTTFDVDNEEHNSVQGGHTVVETLYRNKANLEAIFRIIDKDNSGYITSNEFIEACHVIKEHIPCSVSDDQLEEICKLMDLNKDGLIDLNEFLESFRMVDPESRGFCHEPDTDTTRIRKSTS